MNRDYPSLSKYADFLLRNHLDELARLSIQKAREENLPILKQLTHLTENQIFEMSKKGLAEDVLIPLIEGKPFEKVMQSIADWKANILILPKDQISGVDITGIYHVRKLSILEMLQYYDYNKNEGIELHKEIENYFNVCLNLGYQAYEEIQRGALKESQEILNGILCNIPVIVSRIDKTGIMTKSIGCGLTSLGAKDGEFEGTNVFANYPDAENTRRAINGEKIFFDGVAKGKNGEVRYYQNYFFPEANGAIGFSMYITEQKIAEEKLKQQLRIFDTALSNTVDFNYILDLEGHFIYVNKPLLKLWGKTQEEAFGKNFKELGYPDELVKLHNAQIKTVIETRQLVKGENSYTNHEGKTGYYQYVFMPVLDNEGKVEAIAGTTHDITDLKEAAEKQYRSIFESTNDAILIYDESGCLVEVNPAGYKMHGYSYEEMLGINGKDFIAREDHSIFKDFISEVREGKHYFASLRHIRKDGSILYVEKTGTGFTFKGRPHLLAVVHDITEKKKAEDALRESEDRFRTMADNLPNLAWIANADGGIFWYNKKWYEYSGTTPQEMQGWGWQSIHHPDELPKVMERWTQSISTGQPFEMTFPLKGADNIFRPFLTRVNPVKNKEGKIVRWFGTNTDISELENKNKELLKINADLDNFIYTASHDLKAPIANLEGLINSFFEDITDNTLDNNQLVNYRSLIGSSIQRFQNTIQELTEISKIQKGGGITEKIYLPDLIEDVKLDINDLIGKYNAKIITDFAKCEEIYFVRKNLKSIFYNLISNGIKYSDPKREPVVEIRCFKENSNYFIEVRDNGLGIKAQNKSKLFTMFKRFHDHVEGTGIGLYIVKRIIENSGGKIEVESQEGQGALFRIILPVTRR
ncbi:MAG: PAS domain S-box protein [Cytophagaceae bacterium]|nr:PAS domain S-box protein [Cytophagaceae bacterium]